MVPRRSFLYYKNNFSLHRFVAEETGGDFLRGVKECPSSIYIFIHIKVYLTQKFKPKMERGGESGEISSSKICSKFLLLYFFKRHIHPMSHHPLSPGLSYPIPSILMG